MAEAQLTVRSAVPSGAASAVTIESLRARLLSERAASKEARQQAHDIAVKVFELQNRLNAEIEHRKKAQMAMAEVLEVLKIKGITLDIMAHPSVFSKSSGSEETGHAKSLKDREGDISSNEDASYAQNGNHQGNSSEAAHLKGLGFSSEEGTNPESGHSHNVDYSEELHVDLGTCLGGNSKLEKECATSNQIPCHDQAICSAPDEQECSLLDQPVEESKMEQPSEMLCTSSKCVEDPVEVIIDSNLYLHDAGASLPQISNSVSSDQQEVNSDKVPLVGTDKFIVPNKDGSSLNLSDGTSISLSAKNDKSEGLLLDETASPMTEAPSGLDFKGVNVNGAFHPGGRRMATNMASASRESASRLDHKVQPKHFPRHMYPYEWRAMHSAPIHYPQYVPSGEAFPSGPFPTSTYPGIGHISSDVPGYGRYRPRASVNDSILSLVDDKNGKLGSILMALNLAKQQINDESEYASPYMEEIFEATPPSPFGGKLYYGFYEGMPPRSQYHPHNQNPIIHLPMSPRSDHEEPPFEMADGLRRSRSSSAYNMQGYDPYFQSKGEVHLGNGITLYTD
ncbi:hypothetical protein KP509_30G000800 [Ceratopteris richardii]|uniref:Uncharacterized protein n=1 Tax=Ceratopteris richardii TaxID=49495 RepID=A0A8T2R133_CERRI|nr:hypothetical protein KP509_30G000800 [Ceratopteris richardii]KAH7289417.1 hypothetical protein KP509_30G000800 [Ceratopteris richardii]KAH7289418.1 hypothetical protein KP509_30G000800 [Ceratopteris richardii]KAH7289419.1 hypothetical protein KP509_30G000800 [Ceratopteris richardii]